ncbi:MAG: hypothetical protein GY786_23175 [Proteobacteria bacterium]|nr:hypothetical protein [Pseudomonadota bacterium]
MSFKREVFPVLLYLLLINHAKAIDDGREYCGLAKANQEEGNRERVLQL